MKEREMVLSVLSNIVHFLLS